MSECQKQNKCKYLFYFSIGNFLIFEKLEREVARKREEEDEVGVMYLCT